MMPLDRRCRFIESSMKLRDHWKGREVVSVGEAALRRWSWSCTFGVNDATSGAHSGDSRYRLS
jgi:hypothetical protein